MNRSHRLAGVAFALLAAQAAAMAAVPVETAQDLAKKSGLWAQMDSLGQQVRTGMATSLAKGADAPADAGKARMLACADTAYGTDALRATAIGAVAGALQPADVPPLLAWYDSDIGGRIAGMEQASTARVADPQERLRLGGAAFAKASDARKASLQAILSETRSVDIMADTVIEMATAVRTGMANASAATPDAMAQIRSELEAKRPQLVARYSEIALPAYAFAYDGLDDADLKRYADYLAGPAAKAYSDGAVRGVARALSDGSVKLARCLKDAGAKS